MNQEKTSKKRTGLYVLIGCTALLVLLSIIYFIIYNTVPDGLKLREWFERSVASVGFLIWQFMLVIWTFVGRKKIASRLRKLWSRILISVTLWGICLIAFGYLGLLILGVNIASSIEIVNDNGIITVRTDHFLDPSEYSLYKEEGFLYRRYLRPMDDINDSDPSITKEQYEERKALEEERKALEAKQSEQWLASDVESAVREKEAQEMLRMMRIDEGYMTIRNEFLLDASEIFEEEYDAKGNSRRILYEDENEIRYLMYDRDSKNEKCALYVYYECQKEADGTWSPMDAKILGMYAFVYEDDTVIESGKTAWSDAGTEEYRNLTGE